MAACAAGTVRANLSGMLYYAIVFFVIALIAGALGLWAVTGIAMEIARILCLVFVVLAIVSLFRGRTPRL
jgi:uncharacterized membrane protein YtjA (UPF0391 family)